MQKTFSFSLTAETAEEAKKKLAEIAAAPGNNVDEKVAAAVAVAIDSVPNGGIHISFSGGSGDGAASLAINASGAVTVAAPKDEPAA